jgi:hypothetical protein
MGRRIRTVLVVSSVFFVWAGESISSAEALKLPAGAAAADRRGSDGVRNQGASSPGRTPTPQKLRGIGAEPESVLSRAQPSPSPSPSPELVTIRCPIQELKVEVKTQVPDPWWTSGFSAGRLKGTRVDRVGDPVLVCSYGRFWNDSTVGVGRRFPDGYTNCRAIADGFECRRH